MKCNDLATSKRVKAVSVTGLVAELDLEGVVRKKLDDRTYLAGRKPKLGHVRNEGYRVEKLDVCGHKMTLVA
jgi:hypothetical protein